MFQITIPGGLFGSGGFDPVALQRQAEERGRAEREYQAAEAAKLAALKEEVAERNRLQAEADAAKAAQVQPANISTYYDALRAGEDPSQFDDILQSTLAEQDYITSGFDMAEAGAYAAPVDDRFIVPGGIDTSNVGEFAFDKTLEDFEGYDFDYGNISNENLKKFQEELMPVMAPAVAQAQLEGQSYQNALIQAYERSPEVQEIYAKYDISPQRISRNNASEYVYDPFTFSEIQTVDRSKGFMDYVGDVVEAGLPAIAGAGLFGPLAGGLASAAPTAVQPALTGALTGAATAGVTGGDPLTAALTGGLGGFADPLITGADLGTFGTAGARGLSSAAIAELTGGDPLQAGLLAAGMSLGKDALEALRDSGEVTPPTGETAEEPSVVDKAKEAVGGVKETVTGVEDTLDQIKEDVADKVADKFGIPDDGTLINNAGEELTAAQTLEFENLLDTVIDEVGIDTFNSANFDMGAYLAARGNPGLANLGLASTTETNFLENLGWTGGSEVLSTDAVAPLTTTPESIRTVTDIERYDAQGNLIVDSPPSTADRVVLEEGGRLDVGGTQPTVDMELVTQEFPGSTTTVTVDPQEIIETRTTLEDIRDLAGGGGGGAPVTDVTAPAMTSTFAPTSAPPVTMPSVTPNITPPSNLFSSGSVSNFLLTGSIVQPIAGLFASDTAPAEVSSVEDISGGTIGDTGVREAGETGDTGEATTTGGTTAATAGGQTSGDADSTETAGEGQVGADTAGTEVAGGGAGGSGGGTGTGTGVGSGTGTGSGTGAGDGSGDGEGTGAGSGYGSGGSITELVFSDFINPYRSQPLLEYATTLPGYEAPLDIFRRTI